MDLKRIFAKDEYAEIEREARREEEFNRRVDASIDRFKRKGARLLAAGDLVSLRDLYVSCAVEPAIDEQGREWEIFDRVDRAFQELIGEYDVDLTSELFDDI